MKVIETLGSVKDSFDKSNRYVRRGNNKTLIVYQIVLRQHYSAMKNYSLLPGRERAERLSDYGIQIKEDAAGAPLIHGGINSQVSGNRIHMDISYCLLE